MDLLPYESLVEIADVLAFGAKKYSANNWRKGLSVSRLLAACIRHVYQYLSGEDNDPESGKSHLAHAGCCILFAIWTVKKKPELDDRWKGESI